MLEWLNKWYDLSQAYLHAICPCISDMDEFVTMMITILIGTSYWRGLRRRFEIWTNRFIGWMMPIVRSKNVLYAMENLYIMGEKTKGYLRWIYTISIWFAWICSILGMMELFFSLSYDLGILNLYLFFPIIFFVIFDFLGLFLFVVCLVYIQVKVKIHCIIEYMSEKIADRVKEKMRIR